MPSFVTCWLGVCHRKVQLEEAGVVPTSAALRLRILTSWPFWQVETRLCAKQFSRKAQGFRNSGSHY